MDYALCTYTRAELQKIKSMIQLAKYIRQKEYKFAPWYKNEPNF